MQLFAELNSDALVLIIVFGLIVSIPLYFLPSFIAAYRGHPNLLAIFLINLLLGWLLVGWVLALVWAVVQTDDRRRYGRRYQQDDRNPFDNPAAPHAPVYPIPAMMIYCCPHCRRPANVPASLFGFLVTCASCGNPFTAVPPAV